MICLSFFKLLHKVGNVFYKCESISAQQGLCCLRAESLLRIVNVEGR